MYTIFYKRFIDYDVIFEICLMASKSARMRGSAHLKAVTVAHQKSYVIYIMSIVEAHIACRGAGPKDQSVAHLESSF